MNLVRAQFQENDYREDTKCQEVKEFIYFEGLSQKIWNASKFIFTEVHSSTPNPIYFFTGRSAKNIETTGCKYLPISNYSQGKYFLRKNIIK